MTTFTTEIKTIQTQIDTLNESAKDISEERNKLMTKRTVVCGVVFINSTAKGSQAEKKALAEATNPTTQEKTFTFWRRVAKNRPDLVGAGEDVLSAFMANEGLTSWRKIVAYGKPEEPKLSPQAEALIEAMMLVCQDEGAGIVEGDGERAKVEQALVDVILKLEKSVK
tara:strand:- start:15 stop:518 length:504 start_codon:yes stop_codon:yes gene_type:complete